MASSTFVYVVANADRRVYVGVAKDLEFAMYLHKRGDVSSRLRRHGFDRLVYSEALPTMVDAVARQGAIRRMSRRQRVALVESKNPEWRELSKVLTPVPAAGPSSGDEPPGDSGGVPVAAGPRRPLPRAGAAAKDWPESEG